jgi:hypothetical protein
MFYYSAFPFQESKGRAQIDSSVIRRLSLSSAVVVAGELAPVALVQSERPSSNEKNLRSMDHGRNITWKLQCRAGTGATPIIWVENIFLNVAEGDNCSSGVVDRSKGTVLWKKPLGGGNTKMRNTEHVVPVAGDGRQERIVMTAPEC